jgi:DHA1 family tetracycline resistance protein-like MFS transporter
MTDSLLMLFLARAFIGSMAANSGVIHAYIADVTSNAMRAGAMAKVGAAHGLGFIVGPAIGGLFAGSDPTNPNLALPFIIAAALSGAAFCIACIQVRETVEIETRAEAAKGQRSLGRVFLEAVRIPQLALLFVVLTMTPFVFSGVETTFVLWSERMLGWGPWQNGQIYTFMGITAAATQWFLVGRLTRRFGEHRLICAGAAMIFIGVLLLPHSTGTIGLCISFGFIVFGVSVNNPSLSSLVSKYAHSSERGSLLGLSQSFSAMARITGPAWAGFAFGAYGPDWPFFSGAVVMVVMFILATRVTPAADSAKG